MIKKVKVKLLDIIGYSLFIVFLILISPYLIITGGILRVYRYYNYIKSKVHDKEPPTYTITY